jgi:hypothetical protein
MSDPDLRPLLESWIIHLRAERNGDATWHDHLASVLIEPRRTAYGTTHGVNDRLDPS